MKCEEILEKMSEYLDNEMDSVTLADFLEHIDMCSNCKKELDELELFLHELKEIKEIDIPVSYHEELMTKLNEEFKNENIITHDAEKYLKRYPKKRNIWQNFSAVAAVFILVVMAGGGLSNIQKGRFERENQLLEAQNMKKEQAVKPVEPASASIKNETVTEVEKVEVQKVEVQKIESEVEKVEVQKIESEKKVQEKKELNGPVKDNIEKKSTEEPKSTINDEPVSVVRGSTPVSQAEDEKISPSGASMPRSVLGAAQNSTKMISLEITLFDKEVDTEQIFEALLKFDTFTISEEENDSLEKDSYSLKIASNKYTDVIAILNGFGDISETTVSDGNNEYTIITINLI